MLREPVRQRGVVRPGERLHPRSARQVERRHGHLGVRGGDPPGLDEALADEPRHGLHHLRVLHVGELRLVEEVDGDVLHPQPPERALQGPAQVPGVEAATRRGRGLEPGRRRPGASCTGCRHQCLRGLQQPRFGHHSDIGPGGNSTADEPLSDPPGVDVGGVHQGHPQVQGSLEGADPLAHATALPEGAESCGADAQPGHLGDAADLARGEHLLDGRQRDGGHGALLLGWERWCRC